MDISQAILQPREGHERRQGLEALSAALRAGSPDLRLDPSLETFISTHESHDIEEAALLGLILHARAKASNAPPSLAVFARMLPMLHGGLDAGLRAAVREAFADRPPGEVFDALFDAIADDSLGPTDEHYALWATRMAERDSL